MTQFNINQPQAEQESDTQTLQSQLSLLKAQRSKESIQWLGNLDPRKRAELEFHNKDRERDSELDEGRVEITANKKYYSTTATSQDYFKNWVVANSKGKIFLDYACGNGDAAILAAESGAILSIGIDISDVSVTNAEKRALKRNLSNCVFLQADCENTGLPENSIDTIICSGMLHHLDLNFAIPELKRILKPGGRILAIEALNYNPFIQLYRKLTPSMRTDWEKDHILSFRDISMIRNHLTVKNIKFWHITSYLAAFLKPLPRMMNASLVFLNFLDSILSKIPFVQLMAWQFTFEMIKEPTQVTRKQ